MNLHEKSIHYTFRCNSIKCSVGYLRIERRRGRDVLLRLRRRGLEGGLRRKGCLWLSDGGRRGRSLTSLRYVIGHLLLRGVELKKRTFVV